MDPAAQATTLAQNLSNLYVEEPAMSAPTGTIDPATEPANSGVTAEALKEKLECELGAVFVEIKDLSGGCGQMFEAIIVSPQFAKKTTLARHRLVNGVLKEEIAAIHAWTPKCHTPEEWEKKKAQVA